MWPVESLQGNWYKHTYSFICSATLQSIESIEQKCGLYSLYIMSVLYIYLHTPTYTYPHIYLPIHTPTHTYPCTYLPIHFKYLPTHFTHTYPQTPTHTVLTPHTHSHKYLPRLPHTHSHTYYHTHEQSCYYITSPNELPGDDKTCCMCVYRPCTKEPIKSS